MARTLAINIWGTLDFWLYLGFSDTWPQRWLEIKLTFWAVVKLKILKCYVVIKKVRKFKTCLQWNISEHILNILTCQFLGKLVWALQIYVYGKRGITDPVLQSWVLRHTPYCIAEWGKMTHPITTELGIKTHTQYCIAEWGKMTHPITTELSIKTHSVLLSGAKWHT